MSYKPRVLWKSGPWRLVRKIEAAAAYDTFTLERYRTDAMEAGGWFTSDQWIRKQGVERGDFISYWATTVEEGEKNAT